MHANNGPDHHQKSWNTDQVFVEASYNERTIQLLNVDQQFDHMQNQNHHPKILIVISDWVIYFFFFQEIYQIVKNKCRK